MLPKNVEYSDLKRSEKFYTGTVSGKGWNLGRRQCESFYSGYDISIVGKISDACLEVSESMEVNGKRTFGYE